MKTIKQISIVLMLSLGLAFTAYAKPLTPQQVEYFINSMPELNALGEKYDDGKRRDIDPSQPLGSSLKLMDRQSPEYADLTLLASQHGFSNAEQLADVGDRTIKAYLAAKSSLSSSEIEAGYQRGVANISKDPKLTEDQKKKILGNMEKRHQENMDARKTSGQDIPAVQAHMSALDSLFE